jgi:hypothetical protein
MEKIQTPNLIRDTKMIYLSTQSSSGSLLNGDYKSRVEYDLHNYINFENDDSIEYMTVSVPYACITNSNYIVNETNNRLIVGYPTVSSGFFVYQFTVGNYTASSFMAMFKTVMGAGWDILIDPLTKKFSIKYTDPFIFSDQSTISHIVGFSKTQTATFTSNGLFGLVCWNVVMPRVCNFLPIPRFYIRCEQLIANGIVLSSNSMETSNVLASIPNVSKNNSLIVYENNLDEFLLRSMFYPSLTISITDENNNLINFNGVSSYFALRFNIYRKSITRPATFREIVGKMNNTQETEVSSELPSDESPTVARRELPF